MKLSTKQETKFALVYSSLIGKEIELISYQNQPMNNQKATIIFETANSLILQVEDLKKTYMKNALTFEITLNGKALYMDARLLFSTLQTRLKKLK